MVESRKNAPRIGTSPRPGNLLTDEVLVELIKPLITKLSPSAREILVSVRRTLNPGTIKSWILTPFS
ncbi:hypothetical protein D9M73_260130 [compost metagenome]